MADNKIINQTNLYDEITDFLDDDFNENNYKEILFLLGGKNDINEHVRDASTAYLGWKLKWDRLKDKYNTDILNNRYSSSYLKDLDYIYVYVGFYLFNEKNYKITPDLYQSANTMVKRDMTMSQKLINNVENPFQKRIEEYFCIEIEPTYEVANVI
jgi:hypothetical protein